jgi:hypothetical protein
MQPFAGQTARVRKTPVPAKRVFTAKPGAVSGSVLLVTDAAADR